MKNSRLFRYMVFLVILSGISTFTGAQDLKSSDKVKQGTIIRHKDGTYLGQSRAIYTAEPFWGSVQITLKGGSFTRISFKIRDSTIHVTFNGNYENNFQGNQVYIQQCRNDWKGVQIYPKKLTESQDINKVDAISGATWSYNIFKASLNEALKNAR